MAFSNTNPVKYSNNIKLYIEFYHGTPPQGASIGEPRALVYTSRTAYVSYARVYHLLTPSTLTIDRATSYRLLKYIYLAATVPRLIILYYAFFFTTNT
jgi:hypothetical protein